MPGQSSSQIEEIWILSKFGLFLMFFSHNFFILLNFGWRVDLEMKIYKFFVFSVTIWQPWHPWIFMHSVLHNWALKHIFDFSQNVIYFTKAKFPLPTIVLCMMLSGVIIKIKQINYCYTFNSHSSSHNGIFLPAWKIIYSLLRFLDMNKLFREISSSYKSDYQHHWYTIRNTLGKLVVDHKHLTPQELGGADSYTYWYSAFLYRL